MVRQRSKQIRVVIDEETYNQLKTEADSFRIDLNMYAGLVLSRFKIIKEEIKQD